MHHRARLCWKAWVFNSRLSIICFRYPISRPYLSRQAMSKVEDYIPICCILIQLYFMLSSGSQTVTLSYIISRESNTQSFKHCSVLRPGPR